MADTDVNRLFRQPAERQLAGKGRSIYPNLKLRMYTTRMRQNQLAKLVGINEAYLSRIINGVRVPRQQKRQEIARALGCDADWLFETVNTETGTIRTSMGIGEDLLHQ